MLLQPQHKEEIIRIARRTLRQPAEIWAHGSRVDGSAHDASDLDLVIRRDNLEAVDIGDLAAFKEALTDSTVPILIQVTDWARLPESFHKNILARHEALTAVNRKR